MANQEDKTVVDGGQTETPGGETPNAGGAGRSKLLLFGAIGAGAVVIGVILALFVLKPMMASSDSEDSEPVATETHESEKPSEDSHGTEDSHGKESETIMYSIDDIVINPAGTGGSRFLSVSFGFELDSPRALAVFRSREPVIRDALITILSSKTVAQLTDVRQKEIIRYQIKKRVAELMETQALAGVYYTDFVLQ
jgi:flagellar FliL protein